MDVQNVVSAVTSCRRGVVYLPGTLESIRAAGFDPRVVWDGGGPPGVDALFTGCRVGVRGAFRFALKELTRRGGERLVVFQDDILVASGLRRFMDAGLPEGVVSFYTASPHDGPDGWNRIDLDPTDKDYLPWHRSLGACALSMTFETAQLFLKHEPQFCRTDRLGAAVGEFCYRQGIPFWTHSPSLVQHIGEVSAISGAPLTKDRYAARFCDDVAKLHSGESVGRAAELEAPLSHSGDCGELEA